MSASPAVWKQSKSVFTQLVNTTRELFYKEKGEIMYLGTFRCSLRGRFTADEFRKLNRRVNALCGLTGMSFVYSNTS